MFFPSLGESCIFVASSPKTRDFFSLMGDRWVSGARIGREPRLVWIITEMEGWEKMLPSEPGLGTYFYTIFLYCDTICTWYEVPDTLYSRLFSQ